MDKRFNLLYEKWIRVLDKNLKISEVSLIDALKYSYKYKALAGETPLQNLAIERLLLSIAITLFYRYDEDGENSYLNEADIDWEESDEIEELVLNRWKAYKELRHFPEGIVEKYLKQYENRFWLFHPDTPFYQVPEMVKDGKSYLKEYSVAVLQGNIKESDNKYTRHHFSMSEGENLLKLTESEAARWLIHLNAFSVNVKYNKNAPGCKAAAGVGRLGLLGNIKFEGENLYEELLLNLTPVKTGSEISLWGNPRPSWEQKVRIEQNCKIAPPNNLPELYSIQSRRVHLNAQNGRIDGFSILGGDFYDKEDDPIEQMSMWKRDTKTSKIIPKKHDIAIQAWREFSTLLKSNKDTKKPGVVSWIEILKRNGCINDKLLTINTLGMVYGDGMSYTYGDYIDDKISLSSELLDNIGKDWIITISDEIEKCEKVSNDAFKLFANKIKIICGKDAKKLKERLSAVFFQKIDEKFRKWLISIEPSKSIKEVEQKKWHRIAKRAADSVVMEYIKEIDCIIYVGKEETKDNIVSIPEAYNMFRVKLNGIYPQEFLERRINE